MYTAGKLIFFDPFLFKNGGSKPKFFLVLKVIEGNAVLASLPTSQFHLPANINIDHGCIEIPEGCITCYVFKAGIPITKTGWFFKSETYLHGCWIDDFNIATLEANYQIENVDYEIKGELKDDELQKIIDCFKNSSSVKKKYKRLLSS